MYWFVICAVRSRTRARVEDPHTGPPETGNWLTCAPPTPAARSIARYTAILAESEWRALCEELALDLEQACREEGRASVCEAGPLPVLFGGGQPVELAGIEASALDMRKCFAGPMAAIALELPGPAARSGSATDREVGLCVAPLPDTGAERDRVHSLFAAAAFNVGGADAELRCPDCASPELHWLGGPEITEQMGCANCGARLARESARCAVRVLRPAGAELARRFGSGAGLRALSGVPVAIAPRLAELGRLSAAQSSLALASRADGVIVGLFDGEEALRHLRFSAAGEVARGTSEPPRYVSTVEELPPF